MKDSFMIYERDGEWVDGSKELVTPKSQDPLVNLNQGWSKDKDYSDLNDFLSHVVSGSDYKLDDLVALCIGTRDILGRKKLSIAYLTPRGLSEYTSPGELSVPYSILENTITRGKEDIVELTTGNLSVATQSITNNDMEREFTDLGGLDARKRVIAIYTRDATADTF